MPSIKRNFHAAIYIGNTPVPTGLLGDKVVLWDNEALSVSANQLKREVDIAIEKAEAFSNCKLEDRVYQFYFSNSSEWQDLEQYHG